MCGGKNPFEATDMKMGVKEIKIEEVVQIGDRYYIKGKNFNEYSKVTLDGKTLKTIYLGSNILGLQEEVDPEDVFFMDNTNIINGIGKWKYLKDVPAGEAVDQILHKGSKVQIPGTFDVVDINVKDNTAKVRIDGKEYWISSIPLKEV